MLLIYIICFRLYLLINSSYLLSISIASNIIFIFVIKLESGALCNEVVEECVLVFLEILFPLGLRGGLDWRTCLLEGSVGGH